MIDWAIVKSAVSCYFPFVAEVGKGGGFSAEIKKQLCESSKIVSICIVFTPIDYELLWCDCIWYLELIPKYWLSCNQQQFGF